jgi:hypothetical protein
MITIESIMAIGEDRIEESSISLSKEDISQLVEWLSLKDDKVRYRAFLLLQSRSINTEDVYPYWDVFQSKLKSENSYQRSIGLMLIAENAKWDKDKKIEKVIDEYLELLNDEKPITIRQCIQSLQKIVPYAVNLNQKIASKLISIDLTAIKETMRKSILLDILNTLLVIRKELKTDEIEQYMLDALAGGVLDKKIKKQIEADMHLS